MAGLWNLYGRQWTLYGRRWGLYLTAESVSERQPGGFIPSRPVRPVIYVKSKSEERETEKIPEPVLEVLAPEPANDVNPAIVSEVISAEMAELHQQALELRRKLEEDQRYDDDLAILLLLAA